MIRSINSKSVLWVAVFAMLATSCKKEEDAVKQTGEVEFVFSALDNSGSRELEDVPVTAVLLSIEDASGNNIYHLEEVALYKLNGQYVSKPLALKEGEYKLTEFMVVDQSQEIKFVTPMAASKKAYLVQASLPIDFGVNKDKVGKLAVEVLDIAESSPADFGYTTFFDFSVVKTFDFLVGVFVFNTDVDNYELTQADIQVSSGGKVLYEGGVEAITNTITLRDGYDSYKLLIEKEGYHAYEETFTNEALKLHYDSADSGPLVVTLDKIGGETTITLQPGAADGKDGVVSYYESNKNYGDAEDIHPYSGTISGAYNANRVFIAFDLSGIPEGVEILDAKLSLFYNPTSKYSQYLSEHSGYNALYIQRVTSAWNENTITWSNQPSTTTGHQVSIPKSVDPKQNYEGIDVTQLLQDIVNADNHGFLIRLQTEEPYRAVMLASSDHSDATKHPKLVVTYK